MFTVSLPVPDVKDSWRKLAKNSREQFAREDVISPSGGKMTIRIHATALEERWRASKLAKCRLAPCLFIEAKCWHGAATAQIREANEPPAESVFLSAKDAEAGNIA